MDVDLAQPYHPSGRNAREIASDVERAVRDGLLSPADPLPTVRSLARDLRVSPATVSAAYGQLARRGVVVADGRRGTRVASRPAVRSSFATGWHAFLGAEGPRPLPPAGVRDLSVGLPDPDLLPDLAAALGRVDVTGALAYERLEENDPRLIAHARAWFARDAVPPGPIAVLSGAFDGLERVLRAHLRPGDRVVIEDPTYPAIRDLLIVLGLDAIAVPVDERGLDPVALGAALERGAEALIVVPRAQNPLGAALDASRAADLREVLAGHPDVLVVEDDHAALVCGTPYESAVGAGLERWAVLRSISKVIHPDLRVALLTGDPETIARVEGGQALGPRWVSHLLQAVVASVMDDPDFAALAARAERAYGERRAAMLGALEAEGLEGHGRSGLNVWLAVREEAPAIAALLDAGFLALPGERFRTATGPGVRLTIATTTEAEAARVAGALAAVERSGRRRGGY